MNLEPAYKLACEQVAQIDNIEQQCRRSDTQYQVIDSKKVLTIEYLNQLYQVTLPDIEISLVGGGGEVPLRDKILLLHYLTLAKGTPVANRPISYKELPQGANYFPTFYKRTIRPLVAYFGEEPKRLLGAMAALGGYKVDYGDVAVTINAFRRVPITIVLWRGDAELGPEGNILFDATISDYLSTEDITVLCEAIAWQLVNWAKKNSWLYHCISAADTKDLPGYIISQIWSEE